MNINVEHSLSLKYNKRILIETLIVMLITASSIFVPGVFKYFFEFPAVLYIFIEFIVRKRSFSDLGFKFCNLLSDISHNWHWILLVTVFTQYFSLIIGKYYFPEYILHIKSRMPSAVGAISSTKTFVIIIIALLFNAIIALYEELIYRGFFIERLSWFIKPFYAILLPTLLFAAMHFTQGSISVVLYDLSGVMIDGFIYGIIYYRTKNIYASWFAHFLANIIGVIFFMKLL